MLIQWIRPSPIFQFNQLWDLESVSRTYQDFSSSGWSPMSAVLTANSAQLFPTVSYYFYDSVLTSMLAVAEYSSYGAGRKPLRVTWPVKGSLQHSTYWLSVPYQYGIPIMVLTWYSIGLSQTAYITFR
jgi:hypothetical protein